MGWVRGAVPGPRCGVCRVKMQCLASVVVYAGAALTGPGGPYAPMVLVRQFLLLSGFLYSRVGQEQHEFWAVQPSGVGRQVSDAFS